ncbi:hypothetical protein [Stagnihabitans tardus]|jgi:hypothetical protein|uniref:Secreted protein n=1 Tax=Stagnihabitans tardus TaxID=2699202 RepID=A0AAE4YBS5_9RHOB|nr:hypothetical protein [Stagnihabitans tardus]NBZ89683.1 hypothetical protein [Stagnihabitans tardus]
MPLPRFRRACLVAAALFTMPVCGVTQGATVLDCLPPVPPAPVTDAATRAEYRTEIGQEFTAYFDEAQTYLRCLDAARAEVSEEINRAIHDYQALGAEPDG